MKSFAGRTQAHRRSRGVTLIELLVVMIIIAILSAIAVPSYTAYIVRSNRAAAKACISEYAQFMERFYTSNMTYVVDADPVLGCATEGNLDQNYTISAIDTEPTQRTYTITAIPVNAQLQRDAQCGTLTLDQAGTRDRSGDGDFDRCW